MLKFKIDNIDKNILTIPHLITCMFFVFSSFYIYKAKPFSPLYVFMILALLSVVTTVFCNFKFKVSRLQIYAVLILLYILLIYPIQINNYLTTITVFTAILYFIVGVFLLRTLEKKYIIWSTKGMLAFNAFYIMLETFYRLTHPILYREEIPLGFKEESFYMYKLNSFMCTDSNFVAIITLLLVFFSYYMYKYIDRCHFFYYSIFVFIILTLLTLSRAAMLALVLSFCLFYCLEVIKKSFLIFKYTKKLTLKFFILISIFMPTTIYFLYNVLYTLFTDPSFKTKIQLFIDTCNLFNKLSLSACKS